MKNHFNKSRQIYIQENQSVFYFNKIHLISYIIAQNIKQKMNAVYTGGECGLAETMFPYFNETGNSD